MEILAWIGFAQGLFVAIVMFLRSDKTMSNIVLALWLSLLAFEFLTCAFDFRFFGHSLLSSTFLLFNPALFIYIRSLVEKGFKLKWTMLLHLLPFVISEVIAYSTLIPFRFEQFFLADANLPFRIVFASATIISWFVYIPLSIRLLHKYRKNLQNEKSNIDAGQNLNWLMFVSIFYIIYCIVASILGIVFVSIGFGANVLSLYNYTILLILIYIISFYGLFQKNIETQTEPDDDKTVTGYKNSILSTEAKQLIKEKILYYFDKEKAYLNPNLNMDLLSESINFPKYQITEVLNVEIGKNFFQFVNSYRIEAVKKMLLEPKLKYSIEAIGYECGFNSKSSFYTVFKNLTGETPVAFRKKALDTED